MHASNALCGQRPADFGPLRASLRVAFRPRRRGDGGAGKRGIAGAQRLRVDSIQIRVKCRGGGRDALFRCMGSEKETVSRSWRGNGTTFISRPAYRSGASSGLVGLFGSRLSDAGAAASDRAIRGPAPWERVSACRAISWPATQPAGTSASSLRKRRPRQRSRGGGKVTDLLAAIVDTGLQIVFKPRDAL
jgi:hypothetical protein